MSLSDIEIHKLEARAKEIRLSIIQMLQIAGSGHTAGPLGMADVFTALYFKVLKHDPRSPSWAHRDRLILSNGHICPVMYATMAHAGYFDVSELKTLRKFGSMLQGHPHREFLPSVETSSGPLGSGLSQAIGMALADKMMAGTPKNFYCLMGDGEMNEGNVWEALLNLSKYNLTNIITIIDRNGIQIDGRTEDVLPLESLVEKLKSFNFNVLEIDGHNMLEIVNAINIAKSNSIQPSVIIAHTIPGKGWSDIEGDYHWHGKAPNKEEAAKALKQIRTMGGKINFE
jgi:transketolase